MHLGIVFSFLTAKSQQWLTVSFDIDYYSQVFLPLCHFQFMSPIYREIFINCMTLQFMVWDFYLFLLLYFQGHLALSVQLFALLDISKCLPNFVSLVPFLPAAFMTILKQDEPKKQSPKNSISKLSPV